MRKMKSKICLIVLVSIIAFFFLAVMPVSAEVTELWNRTYDSGSDWAQGVATDASGNVIVTGHKKSPKGLNENYYTIKYDPDGTELWSRTYDSGNYEWAHGVATDASGNVIVTGSSQDTLTHSYTRNYYTIKYNPDGYELWSRTYDGGYTNTAYEVATDASGNVIVTGTSDGDYYRGCPTITL